MRLQQLHLSKHERFTVKVLLEIRKRLKAGRVEDASALVQATLDALHEPRPRARSGLVREIRLG